MPKVFIDGGISMNIVSKEVIDKLKATTSVQGCMGK